MQITGIVFGIDIGTPFDKWMSEDFTPRFKAMHPDDEFAGFIVEPGHNFNPSSTGLAEVLTFSTTLDHNKTMDLLANVRHKGHYTLRTGLDSSTALDNLHLVLPGDFVYDGFLTHRGIRGGGSGARKEYDSVYVREIIDKYIELYAAVVSEILELIDWARKHWEGGVGDWKYLNGDPQLLNIWREARDRKALASDSFLSG